MPRQPGVLPLAVRDLFLADEGVRMAGLVTRVSYFEVFNEQVGREEGDGNTSLSCCSFFLANC